MNILITGANGQLGHEMRLVSRNSKDNYLFTDVVPAEGVETVLLDMTDADAVRALDHHRPQAGFQQKIDDLVAGSLLKIGHRKLLVELFGIGLDGDGENSAFLAAIDRLHRAAHGGGKEHAFVVLVEEQRTAGFHPIPDIDQQLRSYTFKIER